MVGQGLIHGGTLTGVPIGTLLWGKLSTGTQGSWVVWACKQAVAAGDASKKIIQSFSGEINPVLLLAPSVQPSPQTGSGLYPRLRTLPPMAICSRLFGLLT